MGHFVLNILSVVSSLTTIFVTIMGFKSQVIQPAFFFVLAIILAIQTGYLIFARNYIELSKVKGSFSHSRFGVDVDTHTIQFGVEFMYPPNMEIIKGPYKSLYLIRQVSITTTEAKYEVKRILPGNEDIKIKWIASGKEKI